MALLKVFGMDLYADTTDFFAEPDWTAITDTNISIQTNQGRFGAGALRLIGAGGLEDRVALDVGSNVTTLYFGGSFKIANYNHDTTILRFLEGANEHVRLDISNVNNMIELVVNGTLRHRFDVTLGFWHRMDVRLVVDNSTGILDILIDGNFGTDSSGFFGGDFIGVSSLYDGDTQSGANAYTNTIEFVSSPAASLETEILWDDITLNDDTGTINNTFLGDIRIQTIRPNADTLQIDMTPSSGLINSSLVDDSPGPDLNDFVSPDTVADKDLYAATNVVTGFNNIHGVQVKAFGQGGDVGTQTIRLITKSGVTEGFSGTQTLAAQQFHNFIFETDPDTSAAWIENNVNAIEIGVERDS